jgi:hypothetical protein
MKFYKGGVIKEMKDPYVFVFGSNPEGRHGLGAAKTAVKFGAKYGIGRGLQGNTYALPTKNLKKGFYEVSTGITYDKEGAKSISLEQIKSNVEELYECALDNPSKKFIVVYQASSSNLNGYSPNEIIDQFTLDIFVPSNIYFHSSFKSKLTKEEK